MPVIYVDSASTDGSVAFARNMQVTVVELDMSISFSAARARNAGLSALLRLRPATEYVQFVDGDCELEPEWVACGRAFLDTHPNVAAVCGRRRERYPDASFYNKTCDEEWNTRIGRTDACGGDALFRITALAEVEGYDPEMIAGEVPVLCQRLRQAKWQIWRLDAPMTVHDADMHYFVQYWNRAIRSGFGYAQVFAKTRVSAGDTLFQREVWSALFWTIGVVLVAVLGSAFLGALALLLAPLIWVMQLLRLGLRHGWFKALHMLTSKLAEATGILRFVAVRIRGRAQGAIFYK